MCEELGAQRDLRKMFYSWTVRTDELGMQIIVNRQQQNSSRSRNDNFKTPLNRHLYISSLFFGAFPLRRVCDVLQLGGERHYRVPDVRLGVVEVIREKASLKSICQQVFRKSLTVAICFTLRDIYQYLTTPHSGW